jgi:hypothetical protein
VSQDFPARAQIGSQLPTSALPVIDRSTHLPLPAFHFDFYKGRYDNVGQLAPTLAAHRLSGTADSGTPVLVQSFSKTSQDLMPYFHRRT